MKNNSAEEQIFNELNNSQILIIDDDSAILLLLKEILTLHGYNVKTFQDFFTANEFYKQNKDEVNIIILDLQLIETDYHFTIPTLLHINPDVKIIAMSGSITIEQLSDDLRLNIQCLVRKPFSVETLLKEIRRV
jgi:two-component system cell cycle sensor histidine kinase/response regulator CckA